MNNFDSLTRRMFLGGSLAALVLVGCSRPAGHARPEDGTPDQFSPKNGPDGEPHVNDVEKFRRCPYCGMSRKKWHYSRHLVHYANDQVDPTCSIRCAAVGLTLNKDLGIKGIYAADIGSSQEPNPLIPVTEAHYLIGSELKGTMTMRSKRAYADPAKMEADQKQYGGNKVDFAQALEAAYEDLGKDSLQVIDQTMERMKRRERNP